VVEVSGARPDSLVGAVCTVETAAGRGFEWRSLARADGQGRVRLRLPYATGPNGLVQAGPYQVGDGAASRLVAVEERAVVEGRTLRLALGSTGRSPAPGPK
jgi:hypothetical protein